MPSHCQCVRLPKQEHTRECPDCVLREGPLTYVCMRASGTCSSLQDDRYSCVYVFTVTLVCVGSTCGCWYMYTCIHVHVYICSYGTVLLQRLECVYIYNVVIQVYNNYTWLYIASLSHSSAEGCGWRLHDYIDASREQPFGQQLGL